MRVSDWVTRKLGVPANAYGDNPVALGRTNEDGKMVAGVVYGPFNGYNVHAHIATDGSKRWATKGFIKEMFAVPFEDMGATGITATTDMSNEPAKRLLERLGFRLCGCIPEASNEGGDLLIYHFARDQWIS